MIVNRRPLVSVLIGSYNAGPYLRDSLLSVLRQTYTELEVILIDDGSTDGSVSAVSDLFDERVRVIRQPNCGRPATLNRALELVRGEYYAINDADDISHPQRIEKLVGVMRANEGLAGVFSGYDLILNERRLAPRFRALPVAECRRQIDDFTMPSHDPTGMFRMSLAGGYKYSTDLPIAAAVDYILRIGEQHPMEVLGECLYSYRIHTASITKRDPVERERQVRECRRRARARRGLSRDDLEPLRDGRRLRNKDRDNNLAAHFMESACDLKLAGRRWESVRVGLECAKMHPLDRHYLKALVYAVTPARVLTSSRS